MRSRACASARASPSCAVDPLEEYMMLSSLLDFSDVADRCGRPMWPTDVADRCGVTDVAVTNVAGRCGPPYVAQSDLIRLRHIGGAAAVDAKKDKLLGWVEASL